MIYHSTKINEKKSIHFPHRIFANKEEKLNQESGVKMADN